ncbi:MAG TPA: hypothetical protein CFH81_00250 [Sulfurovum sp. UBA12169]|jgi:hypothetical protein|nr:MAG TPA: hypothetical protein CFH81_00250 [Sulfurovum sp. UBA12169]
MKKIPVQWNLQAFLKLGVLIGIMAMMQGCATHENFVKKHDRWVGQNISHFIEKAGYPDHTFILPNKNKVYVYEHSRIRSVPSMPVMGYGYYGYRYYGMFGYNQDIVTDSCKLFLETDAKGTIVKWGSRGNRCVSE